ncbi:MAG TPA: hypothetical protein VFE27_09510 [Acidobacteriaceae bacterium]|nr:hypothetical protein [Acidobacteriaceae bacterium]
MPPITPMLRPLLIVGLALQGLAFAQAPQAPARDFFPGTTPLPITNTPLSSPPSVISLEHLDQSQMSNADYQVVSNLSAELSKQAALANFDISSPAWHFQQIVCPAFPDYVFLSFIHGPDDSGSSHFAALLPRNDAQVRIVSTYAHGLLPFEASWNRPGTFEVFNGMLRQERGTTPISQAPNWLLIAVCYAELSGYPVQVLTTVPLPEPTLDMLRLDGNRPQMVIASDQSADVTFSDVSRPTITTNWTLHFDRHGQITSASRSLTRQPGAIALKP